jgi:hypothetical protein
VPSHSAGAYWAMAQGEMFLGRKARLIIFRAKPNDAASQSPLLRGRTLYPS